MGGPRRRPCRENGPQTGRSLATRWVGPSGGLLLPPSALTTTRAPLGPSRAVRTPVRGRVVTFCHSPVGGESGGLARGLRWLLCPSRSPLQPSRRVGRLPMDGFLRTRLLGCFGARSLVRTAPGSVFAPGQHDGVPGVPIALTAHASASFRPLTDVGAQLGRLRAEPRAPAPACRTSRSSTRVS